MRAARSSAIVNPIGPAPTITASVRFEPDYRRQRVEVRLSNLMAFDARAIGNWGCPPELYPAALDLVLEGKVAIGFRQGFLRLLFPLCRRLGLLHIALIGAHVPDYKAATHCQQTHYKSSLLHFSLHKEC